LSPRDIRAAIYGTGRFANRTHIPNLLRLPGVVIVAICDADPQALAKTAIQVPDAHAYQDAHEMLEHELPDVLYSCVPPFARSDVEKTAAARGIHLFSEKPQALTMTLAREIDEAIRKAGVVGTVGFRERYRPLFKEARRFLADKAIVHVEFLQMRNLAPRRGQERAWYDVLEKSGGPPLDWGVHAVDLARFMTGHNIHLVQAFYCQRVSYALPLSSSFSMSFDDGATMTMTFVSTLTESISSKRGFTIFYEGGLLEVSLYDELRANGQVIYRGEDYDPWFEQDRTFIEAVRTGDPGCLASDYHDGLYTLAPVLAGWESAQRGGALIDLRKGI